MVLHHRLPIFALMLVLASTNVFCLENGKPFRGTALGAEYSELIDSENENSLRSWHSNSLSPTHSSEDTPITVTINNRNPEGNRLLNRAPESDANNVASTASKRFVTACLGTGMFLIVALGSYSLGANSCSNH